MNAGRECKSRRRLSTSRFFQVKTGNKLIVITMGDTPLKELIMITVPANIFFQFPAIFENPQKPVPGITKTAKSPNKGSFGLQKKHM